MTKFNGDVNQAVMGNVKQGSQLTNEVHLHVVGDNTKKETVKTEDPDKKISKYQKAQIWGKALEWEAITGIEAVFSYKKILDRFEVDCIAELPSTHYAAARQIMEAQIKQAKAKQAEVHQRQLLSALPAP